jgi:metal-sulfur cluster biosynthetic enzyme
MSLGLNKLAGLSTGLLMEQRDAMAEESVLIDALRTVIDPELMINIVDLGLVYNVTQEDGGKVLVDMTLTSPACPAGPQIVSQSKKALEGVEGVAEASIKLVLSPPWTPDRMTDEARDQLGIF